MNVREAADWLVAHGYFTRRADGWMYASKPPVRIDLDMYVLAVKTLGAWAVSTDTYSPVAVEVTRGDTVDGLLWRVAR